MTDRTLSVLIAAFVLVIVGGLIYRNHFRQAVVTPDLPATTEGVRDTTETRVRVRVTECVRDFGRTRMTGIVSNTGNVDLHYVTVRAIWKNAAGGVIGSDVLYALNDGQLPPGEVITFNDVTELTTASRCNAEAVDWW
ncbi:MAG: FxLYD domain-containing protein [Pseudomonadota bacterium]